MIFERHFEEEGEGKEKVEEEEGKSVNTNNSVGNGEEK